MLLQPERRRSKFVKLFVENAPKVLIFDRKLKQFCGRQYIQNKNFSKLPYTLNLTYLSQLGSVTVLTQQPHPPPPKKESHMLHKNLIFLLLGLHSQCYKASVACCKALTLTRISLPIVQDL
jgi:hypothetical protein